MLIYIKIVVHKRPKYFFGFSTGNSPYIKYSFAGEISSLTCSALYNELHLITVENSSLIISL